MRLATLVPLDMSFSVQDWMEDSKVELGKTPVDKRTFRECMRGCTQPWGDPQAPWPWEFPKEVYPGTWMAGS